MAKRDAERRKFDLEKRLSTFSNSDDYSKVSTNYSGGRFNTSSPHQYGSSMKGVYTSPFGSNNLARGGVTFRE